MAALSGRCAGPDDSLSHMKVVGEQVGCLMFADNLMRAAFHLLGYRDGDLEPSVPCGFGTYNVAGLGGTASWAKVAVK